MKTTSTTIKPDIDAFVFNYNVMYPTTFALSYSFTILEKYLNFLMLYYLVICIFFIKHYSKKPVLQFLKYCT